MLLPQIFKSAKMTLEHILNGPIRARHENRKNAKILVKSVNPPWLSHYSITEFILYVISMTHPPCFPC